ncbi:MAG: type I polyketide synthase, partial [Nocardioidaceae bacterium]
MNHEPNSPVAVVGLAAIMPDAPDGATFWQNLCDGRYSISDVPPERWDPELYYDPDPAAPDKTYSRIGGWVREFPWDPLAWRLPVPPKVAEQLDIGQQWAVSAARSALTDAGWPDWNVDPEKVAVIIGNAIGGDKHYSTTMRIRFPEFRRDLTAAPSFAALPIEVQARILSEWHERFLAHELPITEDTMPGELSNVLAGRISNLFNFRGPNFTTDAACASGLAAANAAVHGLVNGDYDAVITGGIDRNMSVNGFVKFCKIGALSATGTRPFDAGADGFVMGEGASLFVLKRLADAEREGDRIYAVLLGLAGSSDGKGKGITAPNPVGQRLAVERAWVNAGLKPAAASAIEAHGTSTRVGDASELSSLNDVFSGVDPQSVALGSVKSNIGHLKAAAGTAGLFKMVMQLHEKQLVPSLHFQDPNPNIDWDHTPFRVNTELRDWPADPDGVRRGGVSAFGFGGTNFHAVLEEYVPGLHRSESAPRSFASADVPHETVSAGSATPGAPLRGALVIGGRDDADVLAQLEKIEAEAEAGAAPAPASPDPAIARAGVRVAIDYADAADLAAKAGKAVKSFRSGNPAMWKMLRNQGVFVGRGPAPKVAFLYTGQGSQYVNMLKDLRSQEPVVAETFAEADRVMTPLLGRPLSSYIFIDQDDPDAVRALEQQLLQTEITQPAVLATDLALTRLLAGYGVRPDMVMGHSLGEYAALVAAGAMTFDAALEAVSARGREMASLSMGDNGAMAAVFGPLTEIERVVREVDSNVVVANINSNSQAVIGGSTELVERAVATFLAEGINAARIPVSHAFHTSIVAPASEPLKGALRRLDVHAPELPIVANVSGDFYPTGADNETMLDILGRQVASPVQFVRGLHTLYDAGARVFVEVGPKRALHGFVEDVLGAHDDVLALFTNHPKNGDVPSFNAALCGLWAAGLGYDGAPEAAVAPEAPVAIAENPANAANAAPRSSAAPRGTDQYEALGRLFADVIEKGMRLYSDTAPSPDTPAAAEVTEPVVVTGAALGLPGVKQVFDDENLQRILDGQSFIDTIPHRFRQQMVDMQITRLVKRESGDPTFETIDDEADVVKLAARHAPLDVVEEFGVDASRDAALDVGTRLAIGAGFDAMRDAGLPLVMRYKTTTLGSSLPDRWGLPDALRDDTGVIFASAFPGFDSFAGELTKYFTWRGRRDQLLALEAVRSRMKGDEPAVPEVERRIAELRHLLEVEPFTFDRRFLFRCLSMGHSQFAEIIGARGPNTQINAACASTTQALSVAEDWIRAGRCRRVVVVSADDVTTDTLLPWVVSGFLASGVAATDDSVEEAATPFDRRRHGMIVGMGAAAFVVESAEAARERGLQPICEVLGTVTANSAFHGTRLDVTHIAQVMEEVVGQAEGRGVDRSAIAPSTVFVSHETYTPARGGSASAEINALRSVFGPQADSIVITNTKGFTGHAMGAGIEDVVAIKSLETGIVPPVPNYKEPDPELGKLNLSVGGAYPVRHALRLAAGFGSQISMSLLQWTPLPDGRHRQPSELGYRYRIVDPQTWQRWLDEISGHPAARLEVSTRRLRVADVGAPEQPVAAPAEQAEQAEQAAPTRVGSPPIAPPEPEPAPATPAAVDEVTDAVVSIVAEMTGYPPDLLDLDLDLEADLGVDTVKQAEVFAAVRGRFGVERDDTLSLRDFPTLRHVIGWIRDKT